MSQVIFDTINPTTSGDDLADTLNNFKDAIVSGCSGTSRPANLDIGGSWVDTTNDPTSWSYKIYTGTDDVEVFTINLTTGLAAVSLAVDAFTVKKVSSDTIGAIMNLVKNRIATSGQVLDGDVVGEIRMIGRTDSSGNPVVAKIIFTATDDQTSSAFGGTLSFQSTPDGSATLTEHMRFINGLVETVVPLKLNSLIQVSNIIATSATIAQLSASKLLVEFTGSTATLVEGINSGNDSKTIVLHNRSTANVTISNLDAGAASADQIKLPNSTNIIITPDGSATLYYCTTDTKWKLLSTSDKMATLTITTLYGATQTFVAPSTTSLVRINTYRSTPGLGVERSILQDSYGNLFAWGINANGQLGLGDVTPRSSPVAVLGSFNFVRTYGCSGGGGVFTKGISTLGAALAWGVNTNGQLGVGDVTPRSSPVAVLGGFKFNELYPRDASVWGITTNGLLYAWGVNTSGQLGLGDVTPRSSPVAVLGSHRINRFVAVTGATGSSAACAVDTAGAAWAWGINTDGNLGVGNVVAQSTPTAVLGSITFADVRGGANSTRYFFAGLKTDGTLVAWGNNARGQLGVGDTSSRSSPVAVVGVSGLAFKSIVTHAKTETVMGLTTAGAAWAWGENVNGQLGVGDVVARSSPVAVLGTFTFSKLKVYRGMAVGIASDGTAYAWGLNTNGQLGVGDVNARSSPVAIIGSIKFQDIYFADGPTDQYSVYGMGTDGVLYTWGVNTNGTLGVGDVAARSSPVAILGAYSPDQIEQTKIIDLTVTGGASYTVTTGPGTCYFGNISIGKDVYKVEVEYNQ